MHETDHVLSGIVAFAVRRFLAGWLPGIDHLHLDLFLALFHIGFCTHALQSADRFREVFLAWLFLRGLGRSPISPIRRSVPSSGSPASIRWRATLGNAGSSSRG